MGRWEHRYLGWDRCPDPSTPIEIEQLFVNRHRTGTLLDLGLSVWFGVQNHRSAGSRSAPVGTPA
jgi:hypothetical protein